MPCFRPLIGFRHRHVNPATGLRSIVFSRSQALHPVEEQLIPCGQCTYCRLKHSRDWGLRVALESKLYTQNSFLTLTYNPKNLPTHSFLNYDAPVLFMKRLRERYGSGIRSFGCAEYGEKFSRPHYHLCLLNHDFSDKKIYGNSQANFGKHKRENHIYTSEELTDLWPDGNAIIGTLTLESASYVARYCTKKITGRNAQAHYETVDPRTGEIHQRPPEKSVSVSRNRGLGFPWYEKYGLYVRTHDKVNLDGRSYPPPKYFDSLTEKIDPDRFEEIKEKRRINGKIANDLLDHQTNLMRQKRENKFTEHRLYTIERCQELSFKLLKRTVENG